MKQIQILLLFLFGILLATSTESDDDYFQKENHELFEKMQKFKNWFQDHDKQYPKHSCFTIGHEEFECNYGIFLWTKIVGNKFIPSNRNINMCDLYFPNIQAELKPPEIVKHYAESSPEMSKFSQESTNTSMNIDDAIGYSIKVEDQGLQTFKEIKHGNECFDAIEENIKIIKPGFETFEATGMQVSTIPNFKESKTISANDESLNCAEKMCENENDTIHPGLSTIHRISVDEKTYVKFNEIKKKKAQRANKTTSYKMTKSGFGNQLKMKTLLPSLARKYFTQVIAEKMNYITNIQSGVNNLKPAEIKQYLKEFNFQEEINPKWKKDKMLKKLVILLNEASKSLNQKQQRIEAEDLVEQKNQDAEANYQYYKKARLFIPQLKNEFHERNEFMENKPEKFSELQKVQMFANDFSGYENPEGYTQAKLMAEHAINDLKQVKNKLQREKETVNLLRENGTDPSTFVDNMRNDFHETIKRSLTAKKQLDEVFTCLSKKKKVQNQKPSEKTYTVKNAGNFEVNGIYERNGDFNGKPKYTEKETGSKVLWSSLLNGWCITNSEGSILYNNPDGTKSPSEDRWETVSGVLPCPTIKCSDDTTTRKFGKSILGNDPMNNGINSIHSGRPIALPYLGEDVYLTEDGYIIHAPKEAEKTFFNVELIISHFQFEESTYVMDSVNKNTIEYTSEDLSGLELKFVLFYEEKYHVMIPIVGGVLEVGGLPTVCVSEKIMNKWKEWKNAPIEKMENWWWGRDDKQELYQTRKTIPKFQQFWQDDLMENIGRPITLPHFGKDMYLTEDGLFVHAPKTRTKTLFNIEQNVSQFEFNNKIYTITKVSGHRIFYDSDNSKGEELKFILSYEEQGKKVIPAFGNVVEVGGMPTAEFVKTLGKWERKNVSVENLVNKLYYSRKEKKETYRKLKTIPFQKFY